MRRILSILVPLISVPLLVINSTHAQYFGRNKVKYETHDFEVLKTEHFHIYYYKKEAKAAFEAARMAERWRGRLGRVFQHSLSTPQPVILYGNSIPFRATRAISGMISEGVGGVTEPLKRRVVLPFAGSFSDTNHVLGHELVHAYQYDMAQSGEVNVFGGGGGGLEALPGWFIEGMAEYLSIGPISTMTSMWMRDAVLHDDIPTIDDLDNPKYFPYRYGHALWAYIGGRYGDEAIGKILRAAIQSGRAKQALSSVLGTSVEDLSKSWHAALLDLDGPVLHATVPASDQGRSVFSSDPEETIYVSPSISPDGKRVALFSQKDVFSLELYLADVESGEIISKLTETAVSPHFQSLEFIDSAGAWSPDGREFVFAAVSAGQPELTIVNTENGNKVKEIRLDQLGEIFNPSWSPDGTRIAFSALTGGIVDLYILDVQSEKLRQITDDLFAEIQPDWSPDGKSVAVATDRYTSNTDDLDFGRFVLARIDAATGEMTQLASPEQGDATNPQWSPDGTKLYFLSDATGIRNIYELEPDGGSIRRLSDLQTGASGITRLSPALSVAAKSDRMVFTVFLKGGYALYSADSPARVAEATLGKPPVHGADVLPPREKAAGLVASELQQPRKSLPTGREFEETDYHPGLSLDHIAPPSFGVGVSDFGTFVGGGTSLYFSDMLGFHQLVTTVQINSDSGTFLNGLTGVAQYVNQRNRWTWGVQGGQVPFVSGGLQQGTTQVNGDTVFAQREIRFWQIDRQLQGLLWYPFNEAQRIEFSGGYENIAFDAQANTRYYDPVTGQFLGSNTTDIASPDSLHLGTASTALVYDTSLFGGTSPVLGQRYRFEASGVGGDLGYGAFLGDFRKYVMPVRPITLAGRLLFYGRYGGGAEDQRLQQLFIGYPSLVRGYTFGSFSAAECEAAGGDAESGSCPVFDQLLGSRISVANLELRVPLLGPLGLITKDFLPVEIAPFFDAGVAWTSKNGPAFATDGSRHVVTSHGASLRVNLMGFAVGQISLVHPNDRPLKNWIWEFSLVPGF